MIEQLEKRLLLSAQAYTWQNAVIGAGGFVDGIYYSPTQNGVMYAHTDIGGLYKSTNDGQNWTQLLDFVGNNTSTSGNDTQEQEIGVLSFAIDPENPNNLYADVGEYTGTNGAVFYSTNAGATWSQTSLSFYVGGNENGRGDEDQIQVDPNDSSIVLLGSNANGLWESSNAGHSFSQVSTFSQSATTFVLFDPSGTAGSPSQTIFVGVDSTSSGTNLYETTNGGTSWSEVGITSGTGPTGELPGRGVISGGYLYLTYSNVLAPSSTPSKGGVFRFDISTGAWANISPLSATKVGYIGIAADPNNPATIVVSTFNDYSGPDQIFRTVNANAATPSWTELVDFSSSVEENYGFAGFNTTRSYTNFPYTEATDDGTSNWVDAIAIDPFNSDQLMYGTGQGIWATNNLNDNGTNGQLTAANSWYFPDAGIEFTNVIGISAGSSGVPLFSAMGDIYGFAHTTLTSSPAQGGDYYFSATSSAYAVDEADNVAVIAGAVAITTGASGTSGGASTTYYGMYSTNDGLSYTPFTESPASTSGSGSIAVSANGSTIVWVQGKLEPYYSTNDGASWTQTATSMTTGGQIVADRINANDFYYYVGNDVYFSGNGGQSFTLETSSAPIGGKIVVNPFATGDLWIAASGGVYHSSNDGANFSQVSSISTNSLIALGAAAPGQATPAIYVYATIGGFLGIYRSDDGGSTWTQINSTSEQWGGALNDLAADPNVYGRVYIAINGRGVIMGNPASSLPTNWVDADINTPGNPGWATSSTTLSNGNTVNEWIINGGGNGLSGNTFSITSLTDSDTTAPGPVFATAVTSSPNGLSVGDQVTISGATQGGYDGTFLVASIINSTTFTYVTTPGLATATGTIIATTNDQFNFAYEPMSGNVTVSAQLLSLTNADDGNGTPVAGVMIRSSTDDNDPFVAMVQTDNNSLEFEYRTTSGGSVSTVTMGSVPVGSEYVEIVRNGSSFSGYYSSNGSAWTQLGSVSITAMPATANVGLAATADFNSQLTSATFNHVAVGVAAPTVANQYLFYYGSSAFDNGDTSPSSEDINAIATNKTALLPGGTANFSNVSSYVDGINGILIAFANLPAGVTFSAGDFQFAVGNNSTPSSWTAGPAPSSVATWTSGGDTFADIVWPNGAIRDEWLQVTVLADANTQLAANDVFYFGSLVAATGASVTSTSNGELLQVTSADVEQTELNLSEQSTVPITNLYDFDRNGQVTSTDVEYAELNLTEQSGLELINLDPPGADVVSIPSKASNTKSAAAAAVPSASATAVVSSSATEDSVSSATSVLNQNSDVLGRVVRHHRQ